MTGFYAGKRVLIAGGLGFIGSHLAIDLVQQGAHVTIVDSLVASGGGRVHHIHAIADRVDFRQVDLRETHRIAALVRDQALIFSLAGQTSHIASMEDPMQDLELNGRAQLSLLEACRKQNPQARIVLASTRQVYGRPHYLPVDESHPVAPSDVNGVHKLAAENYLQLFSQVYGLTGSVLRLTNTYGPHMDLHPCKGFVGVFLDRALKGETIRLFGDGSQLRDFNYVSDVVQALELAGQHIDQGFEIFNLGHHEHHSLREFVETLGEILPLRFECQPFPDKLKRIDIGDYYGSYDKLQQRTGWRPQVSLRQGLEQTVAYYQKPCPSSSSCLTLRVPAFEYRGEMAEYRSDLVNAMAGVIDSGKLILGPEVSAFEEEFAQFVGAPYAVGVSSGTDALIVALRALGIGSGDEVITVGNGPVPTIAAIRAVGAQPRLVDVDPDTLQMDMGQVTQALSARTRCVIPIHLYGYPADIRSLVGICQQHNLHLVEDCAQAHGTLFENSHVGLFGAIGCFSFYPTKNLGAFGDAGMCITRDPHLAERLREQACYGFRGDRVAHSEGLNCRLDELQAAALRVRLRHLPHALARRRTIAELYLQGLQNLSIRLPNIHHGGTASWHQFVIRTSSRSQLIKHLAGHGIDVGIHYATPIHQMPAYSSLEINGRGLPASEQACREVVSLPMYPELTDEQLWKVIACVRDWCAAGVGAGQ